MVLRFPLVISHFVSSGYKNSKRKNGFRRQVTFLRVLDVRMPGEEKSEMKSGEKGEDVMEEDARIAA